MIYEILIELWPLLTVVGSVGLAIFMLGLYIAFKVFYRGPELATSEALSIDVIENIDAIAGDDFIATQLDLARAFIETNNLERAQKILQHVVKNGTLPHQKQAQELLNLIK